MTAKKITKNEFRYNMKFIRELLRQSEDALKRDNWDDLYTIWQEIAATATGMEYCAQQKRAGSDTWED